MHKNTSSSSKKANVEHPKKPMTSFFHYTGENREQYKKKNPDLKGKDILKLMSTDWNKMTDGQKKKYVDAYEKEKVKYDAEIKAFEEKHGPVKRKKRETDTKDKDAGEKRGRKTTKALSMKTARTLDDKFREKYHNLWDFRKQQFMRRRPSEVSVQKSVHPPAISTSRVFYYKDSYEISSVQHFLYLMNSFFDRNNKIKAEKARLEYKKTLLSQLKLENSVKSNNILKKTRKIKLEANRMFSPRGIENKEKLEKIELFSENSQHEKPKKNPYEAETKWMTVKEVDIQLSNILTANSKQKRETPLNDQLLNSPMFKKGARCIDHAFNYYIEQKIKERKDSVFDFKNGMPKIALFQRNASMDDKQLKVLRNLNEEKGSVRKRVFHKTMSINK